MGLNQMNAKMNRETWLETMTKDHIIPHFSECGFEFLQALLDQSPTFPISFSTSFIEGTRTAKAIGAFYHSEFSQGGQTHILIHPKIEDSSRVVDVLIHELIHAQMPKDEGHGKEFRSMALKVGLTGKMTATVASDELKVKISKWVKKVGEYPHASFDVSKSRKKQSTRLIKAECRSQNENCGGGKYKVRITRSLIYEFGCPVCPNCGDQMEADLE